MSAAASTGTGGMKFGAEPRKVALLGLLIAGGIGVFFYNSGGDSAPSSAPAAHTGANTTPETPVARLRARRRVQRSSDQKSLRMQEVTLEAQRGDIDPTLRLDLLRRLKGVTLGAVNRSLFDAGPSPAQIAQLMAAKPVKIMPGPIPQAPGAAGPVGASMPAQAVPIPLKFYGFAAPATASGRRRGFFLDDENVLVADEGETVKGRYRIVSLQPKSAEVEDLVTKNRQNLLIVPESPQNAF